MAVISDLQATLAQGQFTVLHQGRFQRFRVTITGIGGEFATIPFRTRTNGVRLSQPFEAKTALLNLFQTFPLGAIEASAPAGVGSLDVVYEVRTGTDA